jgi:hypothetical protein
VEQDASGARGGQGAQAFCRSVFDAPDGDVPCMFHGAFLCVDCADRAHADNWFDFGEGD